MLVKDKQYSCVAKGTKNKSAAGAEENKIDEGRKKSFTENWLSHPNPAKMP
jgi:hypothetical protein